MEITMIIGIIVYFLNFFTGKTKNQKIANQVNRSTTYSYKRLSFNSQLSVVFFSPASS